MLSGDFRYAKLYIVFDPEFNETVDDEVINALSSQFLFQLGFLLILPIPLLLAVEEVSMHGNVDTCS